MLRRATKIQLILFIVITLVGISYVSAEYVGIGRNLFASPCRPRVNFADSGGIFTNAEVTYRGVQIGKVGAIDLRPQGITVHLNLDDCTTNRVPKSATAVVADRSVVGEQYINLIPQPTDSEHPNRFHGPYLDSNSLIPESHTRIPTSTNTLLRNLNRLVQSVPLNDLRTTVHELGKALDGRGQDLGRLLDATDSLLQSAQRNLPDTIALINNSDTVLSTQLDVQPSLQTWTHSLNLLSQQLKKSDPDIRRLLNHGPRDLGTVRALIRNNRTDLGVVLANLSTLGGMVVRHLNGVEEVFELYPALAAGGQSVLRPNPQAAAGRYVGALGLVLSNANDPPDCGDPKQGRQGYNGKKRSPAALSPQAPNTAAHCTAPASSGVNVRGSAHVPGGDPISTSGGGVAYPRAVTGNTEQIDTSLQHLKLGDAGWLAMLTAAVR